jgi:ECF sigma factor
LTARHPPSAIQGGCPEEAAEVLKVSPDTVLCNWRLAEAWLSREMGKAEASKGEVGWNERGHDI